MDETIKVCGKHRIEFYKTGCDICALASREAEMKILSDGLDAAERLLASREAEMGEQDYMVKQPDGTYTHLTRRTKATKPKEAGKYQITRRERRP